MEYMQSIVIRTKSGKELVFTGAIDKDLPLKAEDIANIGVIPPHTMPEGCFWRELPAKEA